MSGVREEILEGGGEDVCDSDYSDQEWGIDTTNVTSNTFLNEEDNQEVAEVNVESDKEEEEIDDTTVTLPNWINKLKDYFEFVSQKTCLEMKTKRSRSKFTMRCLICKLKNSSQPTVVPASGGSRAENNKPRNRKGGEEDYTITSKSSDSFKRHLQIVHPNEHNPTVYARTPKSTDRLRGNRVGETIATSVIMGPSAKFANPANKHLQPYDINSVKQKEFQQSVLFMITLESLPLQFADSCGFRYCIRNADPRLTVPSRRTVCRLLDEKYDKVMEHIRGNLCNLKRGTAHLMLDLWTSRQKTSVIGIQIRYIENWKIKQMLIGFRHFKGSHDARSIRKKLTDLLEKDFKLHLYHFSTVTADNASSILNAFKLDYSDDDVSVLSTTTNQDVDISEAEEDEAESAAQPDVSFERDLMLDESFEANVVQAIAVHPEKEGSSREPIVRNSCLAHLLQLGIRDALKQKYVNGIAKKFNTVVTWFHKSSKYNDSFKEQSGLALVRPNDTRWNSFYHCLKRFCRTGKGKSNKPLAVIANDILRDARKHSAASRKIPPCFSEDDLASAQVIVNLLEPFANLTDEWQSDKVTSSLVILFYLNALKLFADVTIDERLEAEKDLSAFKADLKKSIIQRFSYDKARGQKVLNEAGKERRIVTLDIFHDPFYILPALLDPRIKAMPFSGSGKDPGVKNGIPSKDEVIAILKSYVEKLQREDPDIVVLTPSDATPCNPSTSTSTPPPAKKKRSMWDIVEDEASKNKAPEHEENEVDLYFSMPSLLKSDNPLAFWKLNEQRLPTLALLARKYLAMPATSASVERLFSMAGAVIRCRRARMKITTAEKLLCYQAYIRDGLSSSSSS